MAGKIAPNAGRRPTPETGICIVRGDTSPPRHWNLPDCDEMLTMFTTTDGMLSIVALRKDNLVNAKTNARPCIAIPAEVCSNLAPGRLSHPCLFVQSQNDAASFCDGLPVESLQIPCYDAVSTI